MIKLETKNTAPSAVSLLEIKSSADGSSVILNTEEVREPATINGKEEWQVSKLKRLQILTFIGSDGSPTSLEGTVLESEAVEIAAAYKVVIQVEVANELKATYQAGRVSKAYTSLKIAKVVEVWDTAKNCLYRAKDGPSAASPAAATMGPDGKINRAA